MWSVSMATKKAPARQAPVESQPNPDTGPDLKAIAARAEMLGRALTDPANPECMREAARLLKLARESSEYVWTPLDPGSCCCEVNGYDPRGLRPEVVVSLIGESLRVLLSDPPYHRYGGPNNQLSPHVAEAVDARTRRLLIEIIEVLGEQSWGYQVLDPRGLLDGFRARLEEVEELLERFSNNAGPRPAHPTAEYCLLKGYKVRWDSARDPIDLQPLLHKLLEHLLSRDEYPIRVNSVERPVWGSEVKSKTIANRISDLNKKLRLVEFPWWWSVKGGFIIRTPLVATQSAKAT
jgi:hypothetical protein